MIRITVILATVLPFMAFTPVAAQDYLKGLFAYAASVYANSIQEWTPLAESGDAKAQCKFGSMYDTVQGVLQDSVMAHMWFNVGAANGHKFGGTKRG